MDTTDIVEIYQLMGLYGHAADSPDPSLIPLVFTDDGVVDCSALGGGPVQGPQAIADWFALGKPPHPPAHHTTNPVVREVDGEVRVLSKWFVINSMDGTGATGDYEDVVVRTPAGWRIKSRIVTIRDPKGSVDFTRTRAAQV